MEKRAKYRAGDSVLIDQIFSTENNQRGVMEKLDKPMIAIVEKVEYTSMGPSYKLRLLKDPTRNLKICYWESDILSEFDI